MTAKDVRDDIIQLIKDGVIAQSIITLSLVIVSGILWIKQIPLPSDLQAALFTAVGFFFGGIYQHFANKGAR